MFINYNKFQDISASINYEDSFEPASQLIAISKSGRTEKSADVITPKAKITVTKLIALIKCFKNSTFQQFFSGYSQRWFY